MLEESRAAQSATGPEIDRLRQPEAELPREVRRHNNDRAKFNELLFRNGQTWKLQAQSLILEDPKIQK